MISTCHVAYWCVPAGAPKLPEKEARLDRGVRFCSEEGPRRRLPDSAVGLPQGPAVTFMPRRLRALAAQSLGRCTPFTASAVSRPVVFPRSPPNPAFALLAEYRGMPLTRPADHAPRGADLEYRCIGLHAASPVRRSAGETPSDPSLRGESRRSDGTATTLRSSRANLAVFRAYHAFGTSSHRWGCAGRSYPSHSTSRSPPTWWQGCARREQVAPIQPQAGIGRVLVWACFVRRKFSPHPAYCGW
jgi:hypothetical protein